jgi:hypothetical protein
MAGVERGWIKMVAAPLRNTDYFPRDDGGAHFERLVEALKAGVSEAVVLAVVDEWVLKHKDRPTEADIASLVAEHNEMVSPSKDDYYETPACWKTGTPACENCNDTGWRIVERAGLSGAVRCGCHGAAGASA